MFQGQKDLFRKAVENLVPATYDLRNQNNIGEHIMTTKSGTRSASKPRATPKTKSTRSRTSKTTAKGSTSSSSRRKVPSSAKIEPKLVEVKVPVVAKPELRKQEMIDLVVARSGMKKKDAKPVVEAALAVLGEALSEGRELNLRPMGKLKISRREEKANGTVIICRVRQPISQGMVTDGTAPDKAAQ